MLKLPLRPKAKRNDLGFNEYPWASCAPFVENSAGRLIHRPREVTTFKIYRAPHIAVTNWCGNTHVGMNKFTFLEQPPYGKLLCERCEIAATFAGLPSADALSGRHVHIGKIIAVQTCCKELIAARREA